MKQQKTLMPDKPFFIYWAPGATHAPHHVPPEWSDKYKGKFSQGWDKLREEALARQKEMGTVPQDAELNKRSEGLLCEYLHSIDLGREIQEGLNVIENWNSANGG